jgi:hypothetical protein
VKDNTLKDSTRKEESSRRKASETTERPAGEDEAGPDVPADRLAAFPLFIIEEIGLSNRHVWAAALEALVRRDDVGRAEVDGWLRPAALIGREGSTLLLGVAHAAARDRITTRLLPAVREALAATIGAPVEVSVVVAGRG